MILIFPRRGPSLIGAAFCLSVVTGISLFVYKFLKLIINLFTKSKHLNAIMMIRGIDEAG